MVRGPDWQWKDQDGGEGHVGTVVRIDSAKKTAIVGGTRERGENTALAMKALLTYESGTMPPLVRPLSAYWQPYTFNPYYRHQTP